MKKIVFLLVCIFVGGAFFSCGYKDSGTPGKVKELVGESGDRTEFVYEGEKLVGTIRFNSTGGTFSTRYEYGRDEETFSDKISIYTSVTEEPERLDRVYFIENGKIVKRKEVRNRNFEYYKYQDDRLSQIIMPFDSTSWYYSDYTYENGNLVMWVSRSMRGDEEIAGNRISVQFEYDSIPNNANIDLFSWGCYAPVLREGLNISGIRNRNMPSKVKDLKEDFELRYIYDLEGGYVASSQTEKWMYRYGKWEHSPQGTTRVIYE